MQNASKKVYKNDANFLKFSINLIIPLTSFRKSTIMIMKKL